MNPINWLYYRYIFLRENPIARAIASMAKKPPVPSQEVWESQYRSGHWARLNNLTEVGHNSVVFSYITHLRPQGSILEIGCGEGILLRKLKKVGYSRYVGIDMSAFAIEKCREFADEKTSFVVGDAESHSYDSRFDFVVLNEAIYYFVEPIKTLEHYVRYLAPGGLFVISIFDKPRTRAIRRRLKACFPVLDETRITNAGGSWYCLVLAPKTTAVSEDALEDKTAGLV